MSREPTSHDGTSHEAASHEVGGEASPKKKRTRWLVARVLIVQVVTLIALYWLQAAYGGG